jgi:hypothetical protein
MHTSGNKMPLRYFNIQKACFFYTIFVFMSALITFTRGNNDIADMCGCLGHVTCRLCSFILLLLFYKVIFLKKKIELK